MRDVDEDLRFWGVVKFEAEAGALQWCDHPDHALINEQSRGRLYSAFRTRDFDIARAPSFEDCF